MSHSFNIPLVKVDEERRLVIGRAAAEEPDRAREIMDYATAKPAFQKWSDECAAASGGLSKGNVRSMHNAKNVAGVVKEISFNDSEKAIDVVAKIVDDGEWSKVLSGAYLGFSVGGGYANRWDDNGLRRYTPIINEISLVDRPCIPSAQFIELVKADGTIGQIEIHGAPIASFAERWGARPLSYAERMEKNVGGFVGGTLGAYAGARLGGAIGGTAGGVLGTAHQLLGGPSNAVRGATAIVGLTGAVGGGLAGNYVGRKIGHAAQNAVFGGDEKHDPCPTCRGTGRAPKKPKVAGA